MTPFDRESHNRMRHEQKIAAAVVNCLAGLAAFIVPSVTAAMAQDARNAELATMLDAPATVQAYYATDLYAKESGYALQIDADIGDHVKAGQVLAVIDNPELQMQLVRAEAAVQQASAALEVAKRRVVGMEADLTLQQVTLNGRNSCLPARP